jgi:histidinol-phosphatase (PHP family)
MTKKVNFHTHHGICGHAYGSALEYVTEAINKELCILGFSDHSPSIRLGDKGHRMTPEELKIYLNDIDSVIASHGKEITILKGLEIEYVSTDIKNYPKWIKELDYLVLGQHFVEEENQLLSTYHFKTETELEQYKNTIIKALKELPISILAHPDLYLIHYKKWDEKAIEVAHAICEICNETNTLIELNANGLRRELIQVENKLIPPYPRKEFFEIVRHHQCKVIVSSDCHHPSQVFDEYMEKA